LTETLNNFFAWFRLPAFVHPHPLFRRYANDVFEACSQQGRQRYRVAFHISRARIADPLDADFVVFGPVFNKKSPEARAAGVDLLRSVSRRKVPVFAVGGVTPENAGLCVETGAKGVAGIRLFQKNNISSVLAKLRSYRMQ